MGSRFVRVNASLDRYDPNKSDVAVADAKLEKKYLCADQICLIRPVKHVYKPDPDKPSKPMKDDQGNTVYYPGCIIRLANSGIQEFIYIHNINAYELAKKVEKLTAGLPEEDD